MKRLNYVPDALRRRLCPLLVFSCVLIASHGPCGLISTCTLSSVYVLGVGMVSLDTPFWESRAVPGTQQVQGGEQ